MNLHQTFGIRPGRLLNVLCAFNLRPVSTGMTYSADSTNSMVGKKNSLLTKVKNAQQKGQSIFDVGYPFNLASLCAEKGAKELSLNLEDMITDIYYHFRRSVKRKSILREYMEFTNTHIRKVIKHVSTRWLVLGKCLGRTLTQWDALKSYFVSNFDLSDDACNDEENDNIKTRGKR